MKRLIGSLLIVFGLVAIVAGALAWVDPVGLKLADDGDPFGTPPSRTTAAAIAIAGVVGCVVGRGLWRASFRKEAV